MIRLIWYKMKNTTKATPQCPFAVHGKRTLRRITAETLSRSATAC